MPFDPLTLEFAQVLGETVPAVIAQLGRVVQYLGADQARVLLAETQQIEANGGMLISDGRRRRTIGGVFFFLARQRIPVDQQATIFSPHWTCSQEMSGFWEVIPPHPRS